MIEYSEVVAALNEKKSSKKRAQFTEEQRIEIKKHATVNGATNAVKQFKKLILIYLLVRVQPEN